MRMYLIIVFLAFAFCQLSLAANGQGITLDKQRTDLLKVLKEIKKQSGYDFVLPNALLKKAAPITIRTMDEPILKVLDKCFEGSPFTYSVSNRLIVVVPRPAAAQAHGSQSELRQPRQVTVTGQVVDMAGGPLPGVTVMIKGVSGSGTMTDPDGTYSLANVSGDAILTFSLLGMKTQEIPVSGKQKIDVVMEEETVGLEEVVAIGYGTRKKSDVTGAVSSVKVSELKEGVVTSADQLLIGKSAGVNVVQSSGEPGGGISVNIRGASSINAGNKPLYVIDGVPIDNSRPVSDVSVTGFGNNRSPRNPLASLNASDIASIEILKDASATAIYGSRGANGVVLITTKGGEKGKMKVGYQGYLGVQNRANKLDLLNPAEYKQVINQIIDAGGGDPSSRVEEIAGGGIGTDWQDEINHSDAMVQNHQLTFSGGSEKTSYYISLDYLDQDGIIRNTEFNRYGARINLRSQISDKFNVGLNATGTYSQDDYIANGFAVNEQAGALYAAYNFDPTLAIKDEQGDYVTSSFLTVDNPLALTDGIQSRSNTNRLLASVFGEYHFTPELFAKVNIGSDFVNESRKSFVSSLTKTGGFNGGIAANQNVEKSNYLIEGTLHYNKSFDIHAFNALAGITYQRFVTNRLLNEASGFPDESLGADNLGIGDPETYEISNSVTGNRLASYIGRLNYTLNDKYLLTATIRADGSSRFGANNKFGFFPSAALAWKMANEAFMQPIDLISEMKLRASWGQTGNQEIGDFPALSTFTQAGSAIWGGKEIVGLQPARIPNRDLKWETTEQINLGLDFGLLNNRISGSIDYYSKKTTDMLLSLPIPQSTGFNSILSNVGRIDNHGVEFLLNTVNISKKDFSWQSTATFTAMKNEVKDLGGIPEIIVGAGYTHVSQVAIIRPGTPLNSYYGWEVNGIWQQGDDFSQFTEDYQPGDLKYVDQNGDQVINDEDRIILGNSIPDFQWSFGNTISYKGFELFIFLEGVQGVDMLNGNLIDNYFPINFRRNKFAEPYLNRWTPEQPSNDYPSFVDPLKFGRRVVNSKTLLDASYLRLKTVRLSYTLPKIAQAIQSAQVYLTAENLLTVTDYIGLDPAVNPNNNPNFRLDFNAYPTAKTIILGLKADF